jgi:hypothetical protein
MGYNTVCANAPVLTLCEPPNADFHGTVPCGTGPRFIPQGEDARTVRVITPQGIRHNLNSIMENCLLGWLQKLQGPSTFQGEITQTMDSIRCHQCFIKYPNCSNSRCYNRLQFCSFMSGSCVHPTFSRSTTTKHASIYKN